MFAAGVLVHIDIFLGRSTLLFRQVAKQTIHHQRHLVTVVHRLPL